MRGADVRSKTVFSDDILAVLRCKDGAVVGCWVGCLVHLVGLSAKKAPGHYCRLCNMTWRYSKEALLRDMPGPGTVRRNRYGKPGTRFMGHYGYDDNGKKYIALNAHYRISSANKQKMKFPLPPSLFPPFRPIHIHITN